MQQPPLPSLSGHAIHGETLGHHPLPIGEISRGGNADIYRTHLRLFGYLPRPLGGIYWVYVYRVWFVEWARGEISILVGWSSL